MALPDNAFQAFFTVGVLVFVLLVAIMVLRRGPPAGRVALVVDTGNGLERGGLHLRAVNAGGRLTAVEDVFLASDGRSVSVSGLGTILNLPRDLRPGEQVDLRLSARELVAALERLRLQQPRFSVVLQVFGGVSVRSRDLDVPTVWHHRLAPKRRSGDGARGPGSGRTGAAPAPRGDQRLP